MNVKNGNRIVKNNHKKQRHANLKKLRFPVFLSGNMGGNNYFSDINLRRVNPAVSTVKNNRKKTDTMIKNAIIQAMADRKISQSELSRRVGYNVSSLNQFLNGKRSVPFQVLEAILKELEIELI